MKFGELSIESFTDAVADRVSVPGGGAVAGVTLAQAAALGSMVLKFSRGKKTFAEHESRYDRIEPELERARREAIALADADAAGFEKLAALFPLAEDDPHRIATWPEAVIAAIEPPRHIITLAGEVLAHCDELTGRSSRMLRSDLAIAARLAAVAADAAAWNVRMNLPAYGDLPGHEESASTLAQATSDEIEACNQLATDINQRCQAPR